MNFFFDRNGFRMKSIVFIVLLISSSNSVPGVVKPPFGSLMFDLQLFNRCDKSNYCYAKISNSDYLMRRLNIEPSLSNGIFNLRFRIEFMCDTINCVMEVKDPYNRVIISKGNKQMTNNKFTATLGLPNSCSYEECQVIVFDILNWNNKLKIKETLPSTAQNWCGFNFDFSHSCDDRHCILIVSNSKEEFIFINMIKSDSRPISDGRNGVLGIVFFIFVTVFVIYFIKLSHDSR